MNQIIQDSFASQSNPFFIDSATLNPHIGHSSAIRESSSTFFKAKYCYSSFDSS